MNTHEEILEELRRIASGDAFNDVESLLDSLKVMVSKLEILKNNPSTGEEN